MLMPSVSLISPSPLTLLSAARSRACRARDVEEEEVGVVVWEILEVGVVVELGVGEDVQEEGVDKQEVDVVDLVVLDVVRLLRGPPRGQPSFL
jgi:hypothetical protein